MTDQGNTDEALAGFHTRLDANSEKSVEHWPQEWFYPRTLRCVVTDMHNNPVECDVKITSVVCGPFHKLAEGQVLDVRDYKEWKPVPFDTVVKLGQHMVITLVNRHHEPVKVSCSFVGKYRL